MRAPERKGLDTTQLLKQAMALQQQGKLAQAEPLYLRILEVRPEHFDALHLLGTLRHQRGHHTEALELIRAALRIKPNDPIALSNFAVVLDELDRPEEALAHFDQALAIKADDAETLYGRATTLGKLERHEEALASYDRALSIRPDYVEALYNRGNLLQKLRRHEEAIDSYDRALAAKPRYVKALVNRAGSLRELEKIDQMLATLDRAITLDPKHAKALVARGNLLEEIKRPDAALADYQRVLALAPDEPMIFSCVASASIRACDWSRSEQIKHRLERDVAEARTVHPFTFLTYSSDPLLQLECAKRSIGESIPVRPHPLWQGNLYSHERIRIAYLSADFRQHPTAYLTVELFELHNRSRFEVLGISFGFDDRTPIRARLAKAFDEFHDVMARSDAEIAKLLNERQVDIAIDLMGFTTHGRTSILPHRPAPIAVNYLGYPGSIGAPFIDYIIADPTVLPPKHEQFYAEKVAWLPDCYQVNDRNRRIAEHAPRRREAGLPDTGFVFCCFNNNYKITAPVFDVWMRLLRAIDGSVIWLFRDNAAAEANLRKEAAVRGVDPGRLVFAPRAPAEEHLARHRLADLFLDTLPYNAHTTASDALWMGLPLVTCCGQSFPGRVAASVLRAIGMPELVTHDLPEYEQLALRLARDDGLRRSLRERLGSNRLTCPLFDTDRFRRHIEAAYTTMWETWQRGEPPRSFAVEAQPVGGHAPLHAGHPVISTRQIEAKPSQTGRSVITGSSAYADDDDREHGNRGSWRTSGATTRRSRVLMRRWPSSRTMPRHFIIAAISCGRFDATMRRCAAMTGWRP